MHVGTRIHKHWCPSLLDSITMFCHMCNSEYILCVYVCVCVFMFMFMCMCVYASVVFKNGKGSFTQCTQSGTHAKASIMAYSV